MILAAILAIQLHYAPLGDVTISHCRHQGRAVQCVVAPFYEDSTLRPPYWSVRVIHGRVHRV